MSRPFFFKINPYNTIESLLIQHYPDFADWIPQASLLSLIERTDDDHTKEDLVKIVQRLGPLWPGEQIAKQILTPQETHFLISVILFDYEEYISGHDTKSIFPDVELNWLTQTDFFYTDDFIQRYFSEDILYLWYAMTIGRTFLTCTGQEPYSSGAVVISFWTFEESQAMRQAFLPLIRHEHPDYPEWQSKMIQFLKQDNFWSTSSIDEKTFRIRIRDLLETLCDDIIEQLPEGCGVIISW